MPERIGETSLAMGSPRRLMIGRMLDIRRAGRGGAINEPSGLLDEDLDSSGGHANGGGTWLLHLAWDGLMHKERGAVEVEPGDPAQVPEHARTECRPVPADGGGSIGDDQHDRKEWAVGLAGHGRNPRYDITRSGDDHPKSKRPTRHVGDSASAT
jgi:hypothetical protein